MVFPGFHPLPVSRLPWENQPAVSAPRAARGRRSAGRGSGPNIPSPLEGVAPGRAEPQPAVEKILGKFWVNRVNYKIIH